MSKAIVLFKHTQEYIPNILSTRKCCVWNSVFQNRGGDVFLSEFSGMVVALFIWLLF